MPEAAYRRALIDFSSAEIPELQSSSSAAAPGAAGGGGAITHPKDSRLVRKSTLFDYLQPKSSTAGA
ncbi:hypothetical protein EBQ93_02540, partial [bacterium]|nr:hypothetical protein [bacterium]